MLAVRRLLGGQPLSALIPAHRANGASRCAPSARPLGRDLTLAWLSGDIWTPAQLLGRNPDTCPVAGRNLDTPSIAGRHLDVFEPPSVRKSPKKSLPSPGLFSPRNGRRFTSARCSNISAVSLNRLNYASYHPVRLPYRIRILIDIDGTRVIVLALTAHRPAVCQA